MLNFMNYRIVSLFFGVSCLFFSELHALEYKIGVENLDFYPYYSVDASNNYNGFAREIFDDFANSIHVRFVYVVKPVRQLKEEFIINKNLDFKFPDNELWHIKDPSAHLYFSDSVCEVIDGAIVSEAKRAKGMDTFAGKTFGYVAGFKTFGYTNSGINLSPSSDINVLVERLRYHQVEGVYSNILVVLKKLQQFQDSQNKFVFNQKLPFVKENFVLSSYNHDDIIAQFNTYLSDNKKKIQKLKKKYGINQ